MNTRMRLVTAVLCVASIVPAIAGADPWDVRREVREGARSVESERREAAHEMRRCKSRECVLREMREGRREVERERREARHEIRREREENYRHAQRYYDHHGYYAGDRYFRRGDRLAHYHPNGRYCSDGRHIAHLRDSYYRGDRRWYRDGRYWNEPDYVGRYYRADGRHRDDDDNDDLVKGILIGAAAVGVIAAIHEANDND